MSGVEVQFHHQLGNFRLAASFSAPARGVTALFGRSGSGKSTVLRCVAGLEHASQGLLRVNGDVWQDSGQGVFVHPHERPIGYVFQEPGLFPHLSVRRNLEYGWKRIAVTERRVAMDQAVELLGLQHLLNRDPGRLSGGERQRVAMARALLTSPRLLLMDEPLSALDVTSKKEILPYLERLHDELAIPVLYVSHSPEEVARLADHVVLLENGEVTHSGTLEEAFSRLDLPLAGDAEGGAVVDTVVAGHDDHYQLTHLEFPGGRFAVSRRDLPVGHHLRLRVPAINVSITLDHAADTSILNIFPARVMDMAEVNGSKVMVRLDTGGAVLLSLVTRMSADHLGLSAGKQVFAQVKSVSLLT